MSIEFSPHQEIQREPKSFSLKDAKREASLIKDTQFKNLLESVLQNEFNIDLRTSNLVVTKSVIEPDVSILHSADFGTFSNLGLRLGKSLSVEKLDEASETWETVKSDEDLIKHLENRLDTNSCNDSDNRVYLSSFSEKVSKDLIGIKDKYLEHQLEILGVVDANSAKEELKKHTSIDFEGKIKFKKLNTKGKVFDYKVRSGKAFRKDAETVLATHERIPEVEKKINSDLLAFFGGASLVLLNQFVIHGDPGTLQALTIFGSLASFIAIQGAQIAENRFTEGTKVGNAVREVKKVATKVFYATVGMAGAEIAVSAMHGVIYQPSLGKHKPISENPQSLPAHHDSPETQNQVAEKTPSLNDLIKIDPSKTTESQLKVQVEKAISGTNWVNPENNISKADVITQWIEKFWGHNKGGHLTQVEIDALKLVDKTQSYSGFRNVRTAVNNFISTFVN